MKIHAQRRWILLGGLAAGFAGMLSCAAMPAAAQTPASTLIPIAVDTAVPIVVNAIKPKPLPAGIVKFEGYVMSANTAQITVRAKGNDLAIQTFALSKGASEKMQETIDKGGYQYGDKVTVLYNTSNVVAVKIKGKPSRGL